MPATANMRKLSMGVVIIIAMVAVLLPVCMTLSCNMSVGQMLGSSTFGFGENCVKVVTTGAQAAITPGSQQSLILTLVAALGMMLVYAFPPLAMRPLRAVAEVPPDPPDDPRGVRLII